MDPLDSPEAITAFIELLRDGHVEEFEGLGIRVRFKPGDAPPKADSVDATIRDIAKQETRRELAGRNLWADPALWPDGQRPSFDNGEE